MKKKIFKKFLLFSLILSYLFLFNFVLITAALAADYAPATDYYGLNTTAENAGMNPTTESTKTIPTMLGAAINYIFGVVGVIFLTVILIGGYEWMVAGGNEDKVAKAKKFIINGINGIIVIFLAYALVYIILFSLEQASNATTSS